jgi:uncharacterized protein (TIGR02246 family)
METTKVNTDQIRSEIEQMVSQFMDTYNQGDATGVAALYSERGMVLPPNNNIVEGRLQIESFWQSLMDMGVKNLKLQVVEVEQQDDTAYEVGRAAIADKDNNPIDELKYIVIWKRENGAWMLYRDIFNSNTKEQQA